MDKYLPLGSVVRLTDGHKRVMIYGRLQRQPESGTMWDYVACLYPEGNIGAEYTYLFNHDQVDQVYFIGFQDPDELVYRERLAAAGAAVSG